MAFLFAVFHEAAAGRQRSSAEPPWTGRLTSPAHPSHAEELRKRAVHPQPSPPLIQSLPSLLLIFLIKSTLLLMASLFFVAPLHLSPRLVASEFGAAESAVDTVATVAFRFYLVIIVQTLTN